MDDMLEELIDRFGDVPRKVQQLLQIAGLKGACTFSLCDGSGTKGEEFRFTMYRKSEGQSAENSSVDSELPGKSGV